jgi:hypothetical protein
MACRIENIQDEKLQKYIKRYGTDAGITMYLKENATLLEELNVSDGIKTSKEIIDYQKSINNYNLENDSNHGVLVLDKGKWTTPDKVNLTTGKKYNTKFNIDWGNSVNDEVYASPGIDQPPMEDGEFDETYLYSISNEGEQSMYDEASISNAFENTEIGFGEDVSNHINDIPVTRDEMQELPILDEDVDFIEIYQNINPKDIKGLHSGIPLILRQAQIKIKSINSLIGKLQTNEDTLKRELQELRKIVQPNDERIEDLVRRIDRIREKKQDMIVEQKSLLNDVNDMFTSDGRNFTIDNLRRLFDSHKKFALRIANAKDASADDMVTAMDSMTMWKNVSQSLLNQGTLIHDEIQQALHEIEQGASDDLVIKLRTKAGDMFLKESQSFVKNMKQDDLEKAEDIDIIRRKTMTIADTRIKILSAVDGFIKRANSRTQLEVNKIRKRVRGLFDDIRGKINPDIFWEKDDDGNYTGNLIGRISSNFHTDKSEMESKFYKNIDDSVRIKDAAKRIARQQEAVVEKNTWLRNRTYTINPEEIFTEEGREKVKKKIISITGDPEYAEDRINDAILKYETFKKNFSYKKEEFQRQKDSGEIDSDTALVAKIDAYERNNSPIAYIKYIKKDDIGRDIRIFQFIDNYITQIPLSKFSNGDSTRYYNSEFKKSILENPLAKKFYYEYINLMEEMLSYLPSYSKKGLAPNFIPAVRDTVWNRVSRRGLKGFFSGLGQNLINSATTPASDEEIRVEVDEFGNPVRSIPVKYMRSIDMADRSKNLEDIMYKFTEMALTYKHMSNTEGMVLLGNHFIKEAKAVLKNSDGTPITDSLGPKLVDRGLINASKMLQHTIDANIYGNKYDDETWTHTKIKFFDKKKNMIKVIGSTPNTVKIIEDFNKMSTSLGIEEASEAILKKYPNQVIIVTEKDAYKDLEDRMNQLEQDLDDKKITESEYKSLSSMYESAMKVLGRNVDIAKAADIGIKMSYMKAFWYNIFPGVGNLGFGNISILNHATARLDFNPTEARASILEAMHSSLKSIRPSSLHKNKAYNMAQKFGVTIDVSEAVLKNKSYDLNLFGPMGFMSSSEYINRVATLLAMMRHIKIQDSSGKERSLYEAFNDDGEWNTAEFGENKDWNGDVGNDMENKEFYKFSNKVKKINRALHGNMDADTTPEIKRHLIGRLLAQYRLSWMAEGIANRFDSKRYDEILERTEEGRYVTTFKFFKDNGILDGFATMFKLMAFQGEDAFSNRKMSAIDKAMVIANVRKTFHEIYYMATLYGAYLLLASIVAGDDDDKGFLYASMNMLNRIMSDISFYSNPGTLAQMINNPIPTLSIYMDFSRFIYASERYLAGDDYYDEEKLLEKFNKQFPILNVYHKIQYNMDRPLLRNVQ